MLAGQAYYTFETLTQRLFNVISFVDMGRAYEAISLWFTAGHRRHTQNNGMEKSVLQTIDGSIKQWRLEIFNFFGQKSLKC